jgi:hypothetical protein
MGSGYSVLLASDVDKSLADFAGLVGLILTLITLFTGLRDSEVRTLEAGVNDATTRTQLGREIWLNRSLAAMTALLFAAGLPLYVETARSFTVAWQHAIRLGFLIVWPLLIPLVVWQLSIARRARTKLDG